MLMIIRVLYLILIGYLVYTMVKRGGCCGHGHSHSTRGHSCCDDKSKKGSEKTISDKEKTNSINI